MINDLATIIITLAGAFIAGLALLPLLIKFSLRFGFTDAPNHRKVHKKPIPVIGGIAVILITSSSVLLSTDIRLFILNHRVIAIALISLGIVGIVDDKIGMSAKLRFLIQLTSSFAIAYAGTRIQSLYGFMGIGVLPIFVQYALTIILVTGITNSFNLMDGIDGLAGVIASVNIFILAAIATMQHFYSLALILVVILGSLLAFIKFNWSPAKTFMGDAGSLFLGFVMSVIAIKLINESFTGELYSKSYNPLVTIFSACFMIPVIDTVRVFAMRIRSGRSPFSADKTHLHHKLLQHFMIHKAATRKIVILHISIILLTLIVQNTLNISIIILLQALIVFSYTNILNFAQYYSRWYREIKRMEHSN
jgi:UDP-GlcNAc:undecaprenyl-phosphate/decaprenyl-phosphate GlcNAc-1-phosphate transferase